MNESIKNYFDTVSLSDALWWFIENIDEEHPDKTDIYFYLRERMRNSA